MYDIIHALLLERIIPPVKTSPVKQPRRPGSVAKTVSGGQGALWERRIAITEPPEAGIASVMGPGR